MAQDNVALLYDITQTLTDAGDKAPQFESEYIKILNAVKGTSAEKRLASQLIARFFKYFPAHEEAAIDALLDLCEDEDVLIRKQAIKELPKLCNEKQEYVPKIADVLAQMLQTEDSTELNIVIQSLVLLAKMDIKGFLGGLFSQIINGDDVVRERAMKFLTVKLKLTVNDLITKDVEEFIMQESRKVMQDVTKDEFVTMFTFLSGLKISKVISGQQVLVDMIVEQAELDKDLDPSDADSLDKLLMCARNALPLFSPFVCSSRFVTYFCTKLLPQIDELNQVTQGVDLDILQILAEMIPHVSKTPSSEMVDVASCQEIIFNTLLKYLPVPPPVESALGENGTPSEGPSIQFSQIECLFYTFYQLCKANSDFYNKIIEANAELAKDFKLRLQYLAQGCQSHNRKMQEALKGIKGEELKKEENRKKQMAVQATNNLSTMIKDLFKNPPQFKSTINLSWKTPGAKPGAQKLAPITATVSKPEAGDQPASAPKSENAAKRKPILPPEGASSSKVVKTAAPSERKIYAPPSGKYSQTVKFAGFRGGRGGFPRGGFRGGARGRYTWRRH